MLELVGVEKSFETPEGPVRVLTGASLALRAGESAALLGESGSGKSTMLHLVAGLDHVDGGRILIGGDDVTDAGEQGWTRLRRTKIGLVFQQFHLVPTLNVEDNVRLQARLAGTDDDDGGQRRGHLVTQLGLTNLLKRLPHQLSGGQQQRVAIARALLHNPVLVLADEPTGNLDAVSGASAMALMTELVKDSGASLLMVTHSQEMAGYLDTRLMLRDGKVNSIA